MHKNFTAMNVCNIIAWYNQIFQKYNFIGKSLSNSRRKTLIFEKFDCIMQYIIKSIDLLVVIVNYLNTNEIPNEIKQTNNKTNKLASKITNKQTN
jgi:hypothetical protein